MAMNAEQNTEACPKYEVLLEDYLEGELAGRAASEVEAHLSACSACREALELSRVASQLLRAGCEPAGKPGPAFVRDVMARIQVAQEGQSARDRFWKPLEALVWRLTLSAALALVLLLAYGLRLRPAPPAVTAVSQVQAGDLLEPVQQPATGDEVLLSIAENSHGK